MLISNTNTNNISLANTAITSYINVAQTSTLSRLLILILILK